MRRSLSPSSVGSAAVAYVELLFANAGATPTQSEREALSQLTFGELPAARRRRECGRKRLRLQRQYNSALCDAVLRLSSTKSDDAPDNNFNGFDFGLRSLTQFTDRVRTRG